MDDSVQDELVRALVHTPAGSWGTDAEDGDASPAGSEDEEGRDPAASPWFTRRERTLLDYADRVTLAPASVTEPHIAALRAVGLDDRAIHDACSIIAYFAFVNRIADGLGVDLENDREWKDGPG